MLFELFIVAFVAILISAYYTFAHQNLVAASILSLLLVVVGVTVYLNGIEKKNGTTLTYTGANLTATTDTYKTYSITDDVFVGFIGWAFLPFGMITSVWTFLMPFLSRGGFS